MKPNVSFQKAIWIAHELSEDPDDVYDVLLGNITKPQELVNRVESESDRYDDKKERGLSEKRVH